jgi:hypothetical protein
LEKPWRRQRSGFARGRQQVPAFGGKYLGHYCRICGRTRPNEKFSGGGHVIHVCKECALKPKAEREEIEQEEELFGYLRQSNISAKNIRRLRILVTSDNPRISELARIVLGVAEVRPGKRGRLKALARDRRDLLDDLERTGLILAHHG